jgi:hypothetical protein
MNNVTLTADQAKLVMQCLDLAVKTGGLNAAASILPIATAIEQQLVAAPSPASAVSDPSVPFAEGPCRQASAV